MSVKIHDGRDPISEEGFSYLPRFVEPGEADFLINYFGTLPALWENRHSQGKHARQGQRERRILRPVYWLGAWQFACLGYYSEPDFQRDRCVRAEPFPAPMQAILARLKAVASEHLSPDESLQPATSALINFYGTKLATPPVDLARLRAHRDLEPGPVMMISIGQPARFEFVDEAGELVLGVWLRHRSACVLSGPRFKDTLYHRVVAVRHGLEPRLSTVLPDFRLRRVSVSFRHVPEEFIHDIENLAPEARAQIEPYLKQLGEHSDFFAESSRSKPPEFR